MYPVVPQAHPTDLYHALTWPELSYVAVDPSGRIVGYILAKMCVFKVTAGRPGGRDGPRAGKEGEDEGGGAQVKENDDEERVKEWGAQVV